MTVVALADWKRGERNFNPGNIDYHAATNWQGQLGLELEHVPARFVRFDSAENGIRAIARILLHYDRAEHLETVRGIVSRWAPPINALGRVENNTGAYIDDVDRRLGVTADQRIDLSDPATLAGLVTAIIVHENGRCIYAAATLAEGVRRALL